MFRPKAVIRVASTTMYVLQASMMMSPVGVETCSWVNYLYKVVSDGYLFIPLLFVHYKNKQQKDKTTIHFTSGNGKPIVSGMSLFTWNKTENTHFNMRVNIKCEGIYYHYYHLFYAGYLYFYS